MPNGSTYIVDVNKISKPGNSAIKGIYIGSGSSNRESLYACRGTGTGNTVIYDKVYYYLNVNNSSGLEPNAQTVTISNYTSNRTHGNGTVDTLSINPSSVSIAANHSTASTQTTTFTINQALTLNGTKTGTSVTIDVAQAKNYPTSLSFSISPNSVIPASGGTITSALTNYSYSVIATYKSGSQSAVTATITANKASVSANSKGTTTSSQTSAGTITFTASYTCNSHTVTASTTVTIYQAANAITSYSTGTSNYAATISIGTGLTAAGGSATVTANGSHTYSSTPVYTSGSRGATTNSAVSDGASWAITANGNNRFSKSGNTLSHSSMGTTATTDSVTVTAYNSSNTAATATASTSVSNAITSTTWNNPVVSVSPSSIAFTSAASSQILTASATQAGTMYYTSNATSSTANTGFTYSWARSNTAFTLSSTGTGATTTVSVAANTSTSERSSTVTVTASGAGSLTGNSSILVSQAGKSLLTPQIISITATVTNNTPPANSYYFTVNTDTTNSDSAVDIRVCSAASPNSYVDSNTHPTNVVEGSCNISFTGTQTYYIYMKLSSGETNSVSVSSSPSGFSGTLSSSSTWVSLGSKTVSSTTTITLTVS